MVFRYAFCGGFASSLLWFLRILAQDFFFWLPLFSSLLLSFIIFFLDIATFGYLYRFLWIVGSVVDFFGRNFLGDTSSSTKYPRGRALQRRLQNNKLFRTDYSGREIPLQMRQQAGIFNLTYRIHASWTCILCSSALYPDDITTSIRASTDFFHLLLRIPYEYAKKKIKKPPDGYIFRIIILVITICYFLRYIVRSLYRIVLFRLGRLSPRHNLPNEDDCCFNATTSLRTKQQMDNHLSHSVFDTSTTSAIIDNCANTHIWNNKADFLTLVPFSEVQQKKGVSTIGGKQLLPSGIGTVKVTWKDDDSLVFKHALQEVLYFPDSPVCIISPSKLSTEWGESPDEEGTWILSKRSYSIFTWKYGNFQRRINHSENCLPELPINEGYFTLQNFCTHLKLMCHDVRSSYFTYNAAFETTASPVSPQPSEFIVTDAILRYSKDNHTTLCKVIHCDLSKDNASVTIKLPDGVFIETTPEFLQHPRDPDIAAVPETSDHYSKHLPDLSPQDLEFIANPKPLSDLEKDYLMWKARLGLIPHTLMMVLVDVGVLPRKFKLLRYNPPFCASSAFGRAHRRQWRHKNQPTSSIRRTSDNAPGARVSVDQLISAQPGLVAQLSGRLTRARITCATIFCDHHTKLGFAHLQRSSGTEDTLQAKLHFEKFAASCGVPIKAYHADNGRFAEKAFREDCDNQQQDITFCAVGAHHQNGIAESTIKSYTLGARTMLLHAKRMWPEAITTMLWPFALLEYVRILNHFRFDKDGKSSFMRFTGSNVLPNVNDYHPFGCPVYVLEAQLQTSSKAIPKWDPRARLGIYLGHSPIHAGNVALVLNPSTGHVSPQYHVVFDDHFTTVAHMRAGTVPDNWADLVRDSSYCSTDEDFDLANTWFRESSLDPSDPASAPPLPPGQANEGDPPTVSPSEVSPMTQANEGATFDVPISLVPEGAAPTRVSEGAPRSAPSGLPRPVRHSVTWRDIVVGNSDGPVAGTVAPPPPPHPPPLRQSQVSEGVSAPSFAPPEFMNLETAGLRRSSRTPKPSMKVAEADTTSETKKLSQYSMFTEALRDCFVTLRIVNHNIDSLPDMKSMSFFSRSVEAFNRLNQHYDGTWNVLLSFAMASVNDSNDTYTLKDMLKQDDVPKFVEAMLKEVNDHESRGHWVRVLRSSMPPGTKTILAIWSFKRKRLPDGTIHKWKARLCCHGGMQQWGVNYWETYAPVVGWASVRMLLIIASMNNIPTTSIDFVLAFPQAKLKVPVYMELPWGFDVDDGHRRLYVLKIIKNLYGLKDASLTWWKMLRDGLHERGFKQSEIDPCVFIRDDCIILVYVDDCILLYRDENVVNEFLESMKEGNEGFDLTNDGNLARFLGVEITKHADGHIEMTQPHLIERIIEHCLPKDTETNGKQTPVGKPLLHKDLKGLNRKHDWNYRSAIGMLGYLSGSTRPDISMAVHQCARFNTSPKLIHERAVTRICRYLKSTKDKGLYYKPDKTLGLQCYVDADFAGGWNQLDSNNAENVMSRTGYVIMYNGCPILWSSKLQTEIALSTTEAEYIALSQAMREVLPIMNLMKELDHVLQLNISKPSFHCQVFEDNKSCITVAETEKFTPRTKHIALKYHHFKQFVNNKTIRINYIHTSEQIADIFTKPVDDPTFFHLRKKLCGW